MTIDRICTNLVVRLLSGDPKLVNYILFAPAVNLGAWGGIEAVDPHTGAKLGKIATQAGKSAHGLFKLERARGEVARLRAYEAASLKPMLEEAFGVLGHEGGSLAKEMADWLKGVAAQRPAIFGAGVARSWIRTQKAQATLTRLALQHHGGEPPVISEDDAAFFHSFEAEIADGEARYTIEDVVEEALSFVLSSLGRHLSAGDKVMLSHLEPRLDRIEERIGNLRVPPSPIARDALDRALDAELAAVLSALDLDPRGRQDAADRLVETIRYGDLRDASPERRAHAIAWAARLGVGRRKPAATDALLAEASAIATRT